MAGHSKFKNIMHRKGAQDKKRSAMFSKLSREITVAAKMGMPDPDMNPRLRLAVNAAKAQSMPKDNIQRAIDKGAGGDSADFFDIRYEGFGPGGVGLVVECSTDNKNRTVSEIRAALGKAGGNLGETGCVAGMFEKKGLIAVKTAAKNEDDLMELAIDAGADDMQTVDDHYEITTAVENFEAVRKALEEAGVPMDTAELTRIPQNTVSLDEKKGKALLKLMDILDDHDDIQKAYSNFDIPDDVMAAIIESS